MADRTFVIKNERLNNFLDLVQLILLIGAVVFMILAVLSAKVLL